MTSAQGTAVRSPALGTEVGLDMLRGPCQPWEATRFGSPMPACGMRPWRCGVSVLGSELAESGGGGPHERLPRLTRVARPALVLRYIPQRAPRPVRLSATALRSDSCAGG